MNDYIKCKICGENFRILTQHLIYRHGISAEEYKDRFGVDFVSSSSFREERGDNFKKCHKKWRERDPEGYYEHHVKIGKKRQEVHPGLSKQTGIKLHQDNPEHRKLLKKIQNDWKVRDPAGFYKSKSEAGKIGGKVTQRLYPNMMAENARKGCDSWKKRDPEGYALHMVDIVAKSNKSRREKYPYIYKGVHFDSNEERECARILVEKGLLSEPVEGDNCHIRIGYKEIDFKLNDGTFVEYHLWDRDGLTEEEYKEERDSVIGNSCYKGTPLLVMTSLREVEKI